MISNLEKLTNCENKNDFMQLVTNTVDRIIFHTLTVSANRDELPTPERVLVADFGRRSNRDEKAIVLEAAVLHNNKTTNDSLLSLK